MPETVNQRWAGTLAAVLAGSGARHVVVAPGSRSTPLALAFAERPELRCWSVLDERSAGFFALGLAKGSGQPVVVVCTSGSAGAHLLPAVVEAAHTGYPLWVLTADRPWALHGFGAAQTIDQGGLLGRFVRAAHELPDPSSSPTALTHLVHLVARSAAACQRAPLHLNVPFDEPLAPEQSAGPLPPLRLPSFLGPPPAVDVSPLLPALRAAQRGLIVCGPREREDGFGPLVHQLGARLGFPVLAEAASNARYGFDEAITLYDTLWRSEHFSRAKPDLILRFGGGLTVRGMLGLRAPTVLQVVEGGLLADPNHLAEVVLEGDAPAVCRALLEALPAAGEASGAWRESWLQAERRVRAALGARVGRSEPLLARELVSALPPGANLVLSSSMPIRDVDSFAPTARGALRVFSNRGVNGIDGVTSTALGLAVGSGRPTVLFIGDVALLHDLSAWVLAKQLGASLTVVVPNNDGGGIFHFLPVVDRTPHFERLFGTPHGVDLAHVAGLAGARHRRLEALDGLGPALADAVQGGLHLLELRSERVQNVAEHRALFTALSEVV